VRLINRDRRGVVAHFKSAGLSLNFVYEALQAQAGTTLIEQGLAVVTGAINLFTSLPQTIKYRFINGIEPMSVQMFSRLKERDSLIFDFVEMVTEEACRWRPLNLQPGASRDTYAVRFTCRID
jgi:hypothetical protein